MRRREYTRQLSWGEVEAKIFVEFAYEGKPVVDYAVVLSVLEDGEWQTVRVYDCHGGTPHFHRHTRKGEKLPPQKLGPEDVDTGFRQSLQAIVEGYEKMIEAWRQQSK